MLAHNKTIKEFIPANDTPAMLLYFCWARTKLQINEKLLTKICTAIWMDRIGLVLVLHPQYVKYKLISIHFTQREEVNLIENIRNARTSRKKCFPTPYSTAILFYFLYGIAWWRVYKYSIHNFQL